ncbi:MAG: putative small protein [Actinomycetota bacterium]|nr:putative small protein [Actinomycetota bacterium]
MLEGPELHARLGFYVELRRGNSWEGLDTPITLLQSEPMEQQQVQSDRNFSRDLDDVMETVETAIRELDFGSIVLKVHQGQVVSIETSRKLRFGNAR